MPDLKDQALEVLRKLDESPGRRLRFVDGFILMIEPGAKHRQAIANGLQVFKWLKDRIYIRPQDAGASAPETWQISLNGIETCATIRKEAAKITKPAKVVAPPKSPNPGTVKRPAKKKRRPWSSPEISAGTRRPEPPSKRRPPEPVKLRRRRAKAEVTIGRCRHGIAGGCLTCREIEAEVDVFGLRARRTLKNHRT